MRSDRAGIWFSNERRRILDTASVCWLVVLALALLGPVLAHGGVSGPLDILSKLGLSAQSHVTIHNPVTEDQAAEIVPWTTLAWNQVHAGHLPLWNPYSGLGVPLAFNWQSGAFSAPSLVGYLFPVRYDPTVQMLVTLVIGGTGVYVLCRSLGLRILACVFAASAFELSAPMAAWLGWPVASVMSWSGWLCAAAIAILRGRRRTWSIAFFAVALSQMILAGQLDMLTLTLVCLSIFVGLLLVLRTGVVGHSGPILKPTVDLAVAAACGLGLAAPLALPGLQLALRSVRAGRSTDQALPVHDMLHLLFAGFDGSPLAGHQWFGYFLGYRPDSAAYLGVFVFVLAMLAVVARWRSTIVIALCGLVITSLALAFIPAAVSLAKSLPLLSSLEWSRGLFLLVLALTVLSGIGMDALLCNVGGRAVVRAAALGFFGVLLVLLAVWLFGRGHLSASNAVTRNASFVWPAAQCIIGLTVTGYLLSRIDAPRVQGGIHRGQVAGLVFLAVESTFLIMSGASLATPTQSFVSTTPAISALKRTVGTSLVAIGAGSCLPFGGPIEAGILPEANDLYGIREFSLYDPLLPKEYYTSWARVSGQPTLAHPLASVFCPAITTAREARVYGIGYVLEPAGAVGPVGGKYVAMVGSEQLYRMPGASLATLTPIGDGPGLPAVDSPGTAVPVSEPEPGHWNMTTTSGSANVLRLRITDVPGIQATIDGRPLTLETYAGIMVQARIPAGTHQIDVAYRPVLFTFGVIIAGITLVGLALAVGLTTERARRRGQSNDREPRDPLSEESIGVAG